MYKLNLTSRYYTQLHVSKKLSQTLASSLHPVVIYSSMSSIRVSIGLHSWAALRLFQKSDSFSESIRADCVMVSSCKRSISRCHSNMNRELCLSGGLVQMMDAQKNPISHLRGGIRSFGVLASLELSQFRMTTFGHINSTRP
jgi:hypothetical protein